MKPQFFTEGTSSDEIKLCASKSGASVRKSSSFKGQGTLLGEDTEEHCAQPDRLKKEQVGRTPSPGREELVNELERLPPP